MNLLKNTILALACGLGITLCGCGHDEDPVINTFGSYSFKIDIEETGMNQNLVLTSIEYVDYKGNTVNDYVVTDEDNKYSLTSHPFTKVPANYIITINQVLKSGITYDQENYSFGLDLTAAIESVDLAGNIINVRKVQDTRNFSCSQTKLSNNFPRTIKIKYTVSKIGEVSITILQ